MTMGSESFGTTLEAAKLGAEWAWETLYRQLAGPVTGYLAIRGAPDPEDLTSEVFLAVAKGISTFEGDLGSFRSWVFVIAHRRLIDSRRQGYRRARVETSVALRDEVGGDVESEALEAIFHTEIRRALGQLTEGQRDAIALRVIAGLTLEETAEVMGRNVGAVKALQRRGLEALRAGIDNQRVTI